LLGPVRVEGNGVGQGELWEERDGRGSLCFSGFGWGKERLLWMRVEGLSCGRLILCGGKVERGEAGRGKVKMAGGERPWKKQNPEPVGGGSGSFCFFQVGSAAVWLEVGLGLGFFYGFPLLCKIALPFSCVC